MNWTVALPRGVVEESKTPCVVEADSIEDAVIAAAPTLHGPETARPLVGQVYLVSARVEVMRPSRLPLRSV